jgi:DNA-binding response OmpR family regulator
MTRAWPYSTHDEESHLLCTDLEVLRDRIDMLIEERHYLRSKVVADKQDDDEDVQVPFSWDLTAAEEQLVKVLYKARGAPVSQDRLHRWISRSTESNSQTVVVQVSRIRKKLKAIFPDCKPRDLVATAHSRGYVLGDVVRKALS